MVFERRLPKSNDPAPLSLEDLNKTRDLYRESSRDNDAKALLLDGWYDYHVAFIYAFFSRTKCANCNKTHGHENGPSYEYYNGFRVELVSVNKPRSREWDGEWDPVDAIMGMTEEMLASWEDTSREIEQMYFREVKGEECGLPVDPRSPSDAAQKFTNLLRLNVGQNNGIGWQGESEKFFSGSSNIVEEGINFLAGGIGRIVGTQGSKIEEIEEITGCRVDTPPKNNDSTKGSQAGNDHFEGYWAANRRG